MRAASSALCISSSSASMAAIALCSSSIAASRISSSRAARSCSRRASSCARAAAIATSCRLASSCKNMAALTSSSSDRRLRLAVVVTSISSPPSSAAASSTTDSPASISCSNWTRCGSTSMQSTAPRATSMRQYSTCISDLWRTRSSDSKRHGTPSSVTHVMKLDTLSRAWNGPRTILVYFGGSSLSGESMVGYLHDVMDSCTQWAS
mmetsp:Transcript_33845/g.102110  ORF Transcript_33845/g.102110 Transcript_33845/m.102110 type:complete len:207 (-) Transcript_33845:946-1566(-)